MKFDDQFINNRLSHLYGQEEERQIQARAPQLGFKYINLQGYSINPEALSIISENKAKAAKVAAFSLHRRRLSIAALDPNHPDTQNLFNELHKQRYELDIYMCSKASLEHAWKRYADIIDSKIEKKGVLEIDPENIEKLQNNLREKADILSALSNIRTANRSRRISETLELIFAGALALGASDIHIEPEENGVRLRYRLDGVLQDIADLDNYIYQRMMSRLKLLSGMVINTRSEAQDGRFTFNTSQKEVEVRSSIIPGAFGESIVMRLLDPTVASFSIDNINLNPYMRAAIDRELKKPNGLIITTGPTGSGKTTTLYAFLKVVHKEGTKIITIENPVEYKLEGIVQTQTSEDYTFASGLRAVLRQDPDVIMVGEIRDQEVAETAIHAAQTGHLVFSTLHTNSAVGGFPRLIDLGVDPRIIGSSINVIIGQRLVRVLCKECKEAYEADEKEKKIIEYIMSDHPHPTPLKNPLVLYKAVGCGACGNTGFKGRQGIYEAVLMDEAVEEVVVNDPREHKILEAAKPQGIPSLLQDGIDRVIQGLTSLTELERVVELPAVNTAAPETKPSAATSAADDDFLKHIV